MESLSTKYFWIDDIWVTGFLAEKVGIKHQDMIRYWTMSTEQLMLMKSMQSPDVYHRDFLSSPLFRNYELAIALEQRAKWCYFNKCKNNIYNAGNEVVKDELKDDDALLKVIKSLHRTNLVFGPMDT